MKPLIEIVIELVDDLTDDELRELRRVIDGRLGASPTDPAPPPALTPTKLTEN